MHEPLESRQPLSLVGIRFSNLGPIEYCQASAPLHAGTRATAARDGETRVGWVVVAAEQVAYASVPLAAVPAAQVQQGERECGAPGDGERASRRELGALGAVCGRAPGASSLELDVMPDAPLTARLGLIGRLVAGLAGESERYLARKLSLPALGEPVELPEGPGEVIAVEVRDERVFVRLADDSVLERQGPDLQPAAPREAGALASGRRGARHGPRRGARR